MNLEELDKDENNLDKLKRIESLSKEYEKINNVLLTTVFHRIEARYYV
jgi:hypothetical protein